MRKPRCARVSRPRTHDRPKVSRSRTPAVRRSQTSDRKSPNHAILSDERCDANARTQKISANLGHVVAQTAISQAFQQHAPPPQVDQHEHLDKRFAGQQQTNCILSPVESNQIPIPVLRSKKRPNSCRDPHASKLDKRTARCAPPGKPGHLIAKPLFYRDLVQVAHKSNFTFWTPNRGRRSNFKIGPLQRPLSQNQPQGQF